MEAELARSFTWGHIGIPRVFEYWHLGFIITLDGRQIANTHIERVITHGNALVLVERLLPDKHLSVHIKRTLILTALHALLEYGTELLVRLREPYGPGLWIATL